MLFSYSSLISFSINVLYVCLKLVTLKVQFDQKGSRDFGVRSERFRQKGRDIFAKGPRDSGKRSERCWK